VKVEKMAKNGEKGQNSQPLSPARSYARQELYERINIGGLRHPVGVDARHQRGFHLVQTHLLRVRWRQHELDEVFESRGPELVLRLGLACRAAVRHRGELRGVRIRGESAGLERVPVTRLSKCLSQSRHNHLNGAEVYNHPGR